jgi:serine/threonine protein kinase
MQQQGLLGRAGQQAPAGLQDVHRALSSCPLQQHGQRKAARRQQQAHRTCRASSTANPPRPTRPAGAVSPWSPPQQQRELPSLGYDRDFSEHYTLDQPLGAGSFKTVFVGRSRATGERVAVAVIGKERDGADVEHNMRRIEREVGFAIATSLSNVSNPVLLNFSNAISSAAAASTTDLSGPVSVDVRPLQ